MIISYACNKKDLEIKPINKPSYFKIVKYTHYHIGFTNSLGIVYIFIAKNFVSIEKALNYIDNKRKREKEFKNYSKFVVIDCI